MADSNHIKKFTAFDIQRYHQGLLSNKERHELEKAALDDPFLADALEGYTAGHAAIPGDLAELKDRLLQKTEGPKIIQFEKTAKNSFSWWRVAAMAVILAGAGTIIYQLAFPGKKYAKEIVQAPAIEKKVSEALPDSLVQQTNPPVSADTQLSGNISGSGNNKFFNNETRTADESVDKLTSVVADTVPLVIKEPSPVFTKPNNTPVESSIPGNPVQPPKNEMAKSKDAEMKADKSAEFSMTEESARKKMSNNVYNGKKGENNQYYRSNTFRGRVTDEANVGLPFANVTNTRDNVGTYADADGYFNLISPDTVLNVQVRSTGFAQNNIALRNNVTSNQIVLQEDRSVAAQTLSNQRVNTELRSRRAGSTMKLEGETEPEDGWENYDSYLSNNLNVNDEVLRSRQNSGGSVEVSFEVNKQGEPVNIKIEKSLCPKCDEEAKRLIKEGPKWKRKARKGRTKVTVAF